MATGTRSTNTYMEGLRKLLQQITEMKTYPDANIDFLLNLETTVLQAIRQPVVDAATGNSQIPDYQGGMPGSPSPMAGAPSFAGAGASGLNTMGSMPPVDELRRTMAMG